MDAADSSCEMESRFNIFENNIFISFCLILFDGINNIQFSFPLHSPSFFLECEHCL